MKTLFFPKSLAAFLTLISMSACDLSSEALVGKTPSNDEGIPYCAHRTLQPSRDPFQGTRDCPSPEGTIRSTWLASDGLHISLYPMADGEYALLSNVVYGPDTQFTSSWLDLNCRKIRDDEYRCERLGKGLPDYPRSTTPLVVTSITLRHPTCGATVRFRQSASWLPCEPKVAQPRDIAAFVPLYEEQLP